MYKSYTTVLMREQGIVLLNPVLTFPVPICVSFPLHNFLSNISNSSTVWLLPGNLKASHTRR